MSAYPSVKLRVRRLKFGDAVREVLDGQIVDASSAALVLSIPMRMLRSELPETLASRLEVGS